GQPGAALVQPGGPLGAAALRAVAVATGVMAVVDQPAAAAAAHVPSQRGGPAPRQVVQGPRHPGGGLRVLPQELTPEAADDGTNGQLGRGVGKVSRGLTTRANPVVVTWV